MAARIQAKVTFAHVQLPATDVLWAEAMHWACEALNHTACTANPDNKSPIEMWSGETSPASPFPFLKSACCRWKRHNKFLPKAESCFYLGPPRGHPRDSLPVLTRGGEIIETRDVTWEAMLVNKLPAPLNPIAEESTEPGGGEIVDEEEGEAQPAEVWPLAGRGFPHVRLDTFNAGGAMGTEAEGEDNGAAQQQPTDDVESEDSCEDDLLDPRQRINASIFAAQLIFQQRQR